MTRHLRTLVLLGVSCFIVMGCSKASEPTAAKADEQKAREGMKGYEKMANEKGANEKK